MDAPDAPPPDQLTTFLAERDTPCPCCGYNLRALTGARCPECNQELVLQVNLTEAVDRQWIIGLTGLAFGAGFFDLIVAFIIVVSVYERDWPPISGVWPLFAGSVFAPVLCAYWIRARRRLRLRPAPERRRLAAACWAFTLIVAAGSLICAIRNV